MKKMKGLAQVPLLLGLLMMAVAIPMVTKLVEQRQDTRKEAAGKPSCPGSCTNSCPAYKTSLAASDYNCSTIYSICCVVTAPTAPAVAVTPTACATVGTKQCNPSNVMQYRVCASNRTWGSWTSCPSEQVCPVGGSSCQPMPTTNPECQAGAKECNPSNVMQYKVCASDRTWGAWMSCPSGQVCPVGGSNCQPIPTTTRECQADAKQCNPSNVTQYKDCVGGLWGSTWKSCPSGYLCPIGGSGCIDRGTIWMTVPCNVCESGICKLRSGGVNRTNCSTELGSNCDPVGSICGGVSPVSTSPPPGNHKCTAASGNPDEKACCDGNGNYVNWWDCDWGSDTVPQTSFYGVISDGVKKWVTGDDCNKAKGVVITSTGGSLLWYPDHFEVVNKSLTPGTVTLTPPTKCGYVCDRWELIDRRDGIIKDSGTGCTVHFTPLDEGNSHVTFFIKKADVTVVPSVPLTATPTLPLCSQVGAGYDVTLCSNLADEGLPSRSGCSNNTCYSSIHSVLNGARDCSGSNPYCRYYNLETCGAGTCVSPSGSTACSCCPTISAPNVLTCNVAGNSISWNAVAGADHYALRVDANPTSWSGTCNSVNSGDFCNDVSALFQSYTFVPGVNHTIWVAAINSCNNWSPATYLSCPGPAGVGPTTAVPTTAVPTTAPVYRACNDPCNGTSVLCLGGNTCRWTGTSNRCRNSSCPEEIDCTCAVNTPVSTNMPVSTNTPVIGNTVSPVNTPAVKVGCYDGRTCGAVETVCELDDVEKWRSTYFEGEFGQIERSNWAGDFNCDGRVEIDDWTFFWGEYFNIL